MEGARRDKAAHWAAQRVCQGVASGPKCALCVALETDVTRQNARKTTRCAICRSLHVDRKDGAAPLVRIAAKTKITKHAGA
jgi:hypothetical protein